MLSKTIVFTAPKTAELIERNVKEIKDKNFPLGTVFDWRTL